METDEADEWLVAGAGKKSWKRRRRKGGPGQHKTAAAATKKKRRSNQQEAAADEWESGPIVWNPAVLDEPVIPREVDALAKGIGACDADLRKSKLYARIKSIFTSQGTDTATFPGAEALFPELRAVEEVVVYGLGSLDMGMTKSSKYQFALTVAIVEEIAKFGRFDRVHFFDPVFTACDRAIIEGQSPKFSVMRENEDCKRSITRKTLFYMPHCEKHHYNNLLRANCGPGSLSNMIILGNSFRNYCDGKQAIHASTLREDFPELYAAANLVGCEHPIPGGLEDFSVRCGFNDTSFHIFPGRSRLQLGQT